jgi:hypothetical protein
VHWASRQADLSPSTLSTEIGLEVEVDTQVWATALPETAKISALRASARRGGYRSRAGTTNTNPTAFHRLRKELREDREEAERVEKRSLESLSKNPIPEPQGRPLMRTRPGSTTVNASRSRELNFATASTTVPGLARRARL